MRCPELLDLVDCLAIVMASHGFVLQIERNAKDFLARFARRHTVRDVGVEDQQIALTQSNGDPELRETKVVANR